MNLSNILKFRILTGTAEKSATVTLYDLRTLEPLQATIASKKDGSWSFQLEASGLISGLKKMDGTTSSANGSYTLLSSTEAQSLSHSFSSEFSVDGKPILDLSKPTYRMRSSTDTWYLWAPQGGDYVISRIKGTDEWYLAGAPKHPQFSGSPTMRHWYASNLTASQLRAELPLEDGSRSHLTFLPDGDTDSLDEIGRYRLDQLDLAGNRSNLGFSQTGQITTRPYIDFDPERPDIQSHIVTHVTTSEMRHGVSFLPDVAAHIIGKYSANGITLTFSGGGLDKFNDKLILDQELALNKGDICTNTSEIAGVKLISYCFWEGDMTLRFGGIGGNYSWFTGSDLERLIKEVKLGGSSNQVGERIMTVSYNSPEGPISWSTKLVVSSDDLALQSPASVGSKPYSATHYLTTPELLAKGVSLYQDFVVPTSSNILAINVTSFSSGWDATSDEFIVDNSNAFRNFRYVYNAEERKLTISNASGKALSPEDIHVLLKSIKITNPFGLEGERQLQFRLVGLDGEQGVPFQSRLILDSQAPILDMDYFAPGVQTASTRSVTLESARTGSKLFEKRISAPAANDIATIKLAFPGSNPLSTESIIVSDHTDNGMLRLSKDSTVENKTIGGVEGIDYNYDKEIRTLSLQKTSGLAMTGLEVKTILEALAWKTTSTSTDSRSIIITITDQAGNSSSATARIKLDTTPAPAVKAAVIEQHQMSYQVLNLADILGPTHPHNLGKGESVNLPLPVGMTAQSFLAAIKGISAEWGGRGITGNPNTTSTEYKSHLDFDKPLTSGQSFGMAHQGGTYVKGGVFSFTATADGKGLLLTNKGGSYANNLDMYQFGGSDQSSIENYDIGNIRILYQVDTGMSNLNPTVNVKFNAGEASIGDVVSVKSLSDGRTLATKTLTANDLASTEATASLTVANSLPTGDQYFDLLYQETSGNIAGSNGKLTHSHRAEPVVATVLNDLKVASPNKAGIQALNDSTTHYASIVDAGTPWSHGNYERGLQFGGKVGTAGSSDKYLITVKMGGKLLAFDTVNAGEFTLSSAANLVAPGFHEDLSFTATNITSGNNNGMTTTVTGLKLGSYWAAQSLGDTRGGHGNDNFLLGATKNGASTLIQTNGGDDTLTLGAFGKTGNFAATVTDFTVGADKVAVFGKSIDLGNLYQFVKEAAPIQGGTGTKLVVDLDGAAAGNQTYSLHLQNVAYNPNNTHTLFGV